MARTSEHEKLDEKSDTPSAIVRVYRFEGYQRILLASETNIGGGFTGVLITDDDPNASNRYIVPKDKIEGGGLTRGFDRNTAFEFPTVEDSLVFEQEYSRSRMWHRFNPSRILRRLRKA